MKQFIPVRTYVRELSPNQNQWMEHHIRPSRRVVPVWAATRSKNLSFDYVLPYALYPGWKLASATRDNARELKALRSLENLAPSDWKVNWLKPSEVAKRLVKGTFQRKSFLYFKTLLAQMADKSKLKADETSSRNNLL